MLAEKQHTQLRQALAQAPGGFQAADPGQVEVHDHQPRQLLADLVQGLFAAGRLNDRHALQAVLQRSGQAQTQHGVIIDQ
ncbi:hypothetical protein D3C84_1099670 [compost metagenome]